MKYLLLAIMTSLSIGCAQKPEEYTPLFPALVQAHTTALGGNVWTVSKPGASKRVLLIHGLTVDHTWWFKGWEGAVVDNLVDHGYEVMFIDLEYTTDPAPYTRLKNLLDSNYAQHFTDRVTDVINFGDTFWGNRAEIMIGGVSFGGLHSMMGCQNQVKCTKYFALIPVVDLQSLVGFESMNLSNFSPFTYTNALKQRKGYMQYCGADAAVSPTWSGNFASAMTSNNFKLDYYPSLPHGITSGQAWDANNWVNAN